MNAVAAPARMIADVEVRVASRHPRRIGWIGTAALAMGGSNQSLFLITALFVGQGGIPGQGSAAVLLLILGLLLGYAAAPGWTELVLMSPNRVGGIAAACTAAFQPYSSILSALSATCYWWGWVPTCGVTALLSATAINQWCLPMVPVPLMACSLVAIFTAVNLAGVRWVAGLAIPIAVASAGLAFVSMVAPVLSGAVDWSRATSFHLTTPFPGWFGDLTSLMAGLYLVGFGAPAFEAAACHVGETRDPARNVPRAMVAAGVMAAVYFLALPVVWLGAIGPEALGRDLADVLGPSFAPVFGSFAKSAAIGFMMFNMFHGTLQPLAGAARTLAQLSEDGLAPRILARRSRTDAPWVATVATAGFALLFLLIGDPLWLIAAANFVYLIGICLPSVAVWLLRRDAPEAPRLYRAPRGTIGLGLVAASVWGLSALLGFEQFGLRTVIYGLLMAYSGAGLYAWRMLEDRGRRGQRGIGHSLHIKLTGAMFLVLALDAGGYMLAIDAMPSAETSYAAMLEDIFVAVAFLTISVGIVLPGVIAHSADNVSIAARRLAFGTIAEFASAMKALGEGRLEEAHASVDVAPVVVRSNDELGAMAISFNVLQEGVANAAIGLHGARAGLSHARDELLTANAALARTIADHERLGSELRQSRAAALHAAAHDELTGLPNRTLFVHRLNEALASRLTDAGTPLAVLFIDLDRFKTVNDSLGHLAGNDLLVQVARRLQGLVDGRGPGSRASALSGRPAFLARLGGDEFTMMVEQVDTADQALAIAQVVQGAFAPPFVIAGQDTYASASIGIAFSGACSHETSTDLLRDADLAMYRAKEGGKAQAAIYDVSLHARAAARLATENNLRRALRQREFVLHYQPIVRLTTAAIVGFEALVRWQDPERGLVMPGEFIAVAEETGLIVPLGSWVLREACRQAVAWRDLGSFAPMMSINISPRQFAQSDLVDEVAWVLAETGVAPESIKLEITESGTMGEPERAVRVLRGLKRLGVQISMDDFGTGYSSLNYLHKFPVDVLKIDRSFVARIPHDDDGRQIVQIITALAHGMAMTTVAEGVETAEQRAELIRIGCVYGQGYLFAKPLPAAAAAAALCQQPKQLTDAA